MSGESMPIEAGLRADLRMTLQAAIGHPAASRTGDHRPSDERSEARKRLDANHRAFQALLDEASALEEKGRLDGAAAYAQVAAYFAWFNHTGLFMSAALERLLGRLGAHVKPPAIDHMSPRVSVLHVMTQMYPTGGPTQAVSWWLERDASRSQAVCVTRQAALAIPDKIRVRLQRYRLIRIDTRPGGLLDRAAALRSAARRADLVVLHVHPYDVVPVIAFASHQDGPPVVYVNHSDHTFWVGVSVASVVQSMRDSGERLARERRGVPAERSVVVPRPLRMATRGASREEAKSRLGVQPGQVLVVTAADAPKYRAVFGPSLLELVTPVFERHPNALLFAAGPTPDGEWARASAATGGRVRAFGRLPDVKLLQEAADVYLDSFPFASLTSLLEAGSCGAAVVTYRGHPDDCSVLGADTRGVDEHMLRPRTIEALVGALDRLIVDAAFRRELGVRIRSAIARSHDGTAWLRSTEMAYAIAARTHGVSPLLREQRETGTLDLLVEAIMARTGYGVGWAGALRENLGLLPLDLRVRAALRLGNARRPPAIRQVLPEWVLPWIAPAWRRTRRLVVGADRAS